VFNTIQKFKVRFSQVRVPIIFNIPNVIVARDGSASQEKVSKLVFGVRRNKYEKWVCRPQQGTPPPPPPPTTVVVLATTSDNDDHAELKQSEKEVDEFPIEDFLPSVQDDLLPCDTLLLMRSMEQKQTCLYVPLQNGSLIPTVLESQLYSKLRTDTTITTDSVGYQGIARFAKDQSDPTTHTSLR
jgi:hypothetical protein